MANLNVLEIKAFVPAKDFVLSKQFYTDLGFTKASGSDGVAYFRHGNCSFLLQNFYEKAFAENLMMHLHVEDVSAWHAHVIEFDIPKKYRVKISGIVEQPWQMRDFVLYDPSGVLWRIGENV